ncbi:MAG: hypothetical protein AAB574_01980 [Patescibacteria group bacterium]
MTNDFTVGDYIVDFENIYQIYAAKSQKDLKGVYHQCFFYRPTQSSERDKSVTASVPVENVAKSGLRHLISKDEVKEFFKLLSKPLDTTLLFEPKLTKEALYLNDPIKTVPILKLLFQNKIQTAEKFARTNSEVMEGIVKHLSDEIAFVSKKSFKSVHDQILATLKKSSACSPPLSTGPKQSIS